MKIIQGNVRKKCKKIHIWHVVVSYAFGKALKAAAYSKILHPMSEKGVVISAAIIHKAGANRKSNSNGNDCELKVLAFIKQAFTPRDKKRYYENYSENEHGWKFHKKPPVNKHNRGAKNKKSGQESSFLPPAKKYTKIPCEVLTNC